MTPTYMQTNVIVSNSNTEEVENDSPEEIRIKSPILGFKDEEMQALPKEINIAENSCESRIYLLKNVDKFNRSNIWPQILAATAAALCQFSNGGMYGFPGIALPLLMDPESEDLLLTKGEASVFASLLNLGNMVGSLLAGMAMTWVGQRKCLIYMIPLCIGGWIASGLAPSVEVLIGARFLFGITAGLISSNSYNYVVELAEPSVRGRLVGMCDIFRQIGFSVTYGIGNLDLTWRHQCFIQNVFLLLPFIMLLFLPDSPRWLATKGRKSDALKSLRFFRGSEANVHDELQAVITEVEKHAHTISVRSQLRLMSSRELFPVLLLTGFLMFFIHFTGNVVFVSYSVLIFQSTDVNISPYLSGFICSIMRVIGGLSYFVLADKISRKNSFGLPLLISGMSMIVLGLFFYIKLTYDGASIEWLPLACTCVYSFSTALYYPSVMLLRGELLPNSVRSLGSGIHFSLLSIGMYLATATYPSLVDQFGSHWTFWLYGLASFSIMAVVYAFVPETKGKSLEEIGELNIKFCKNKKAKNKSANQS